VADLTERIVSFCALLREAFGFRIGYPEACDALRAIEHVGVRDPERVRTALRAICCGRHEEIEPFDRAFTAFFLEVERGIPQPSLAQPEESPVDDARESQKSLKHSYPAEDEAPNAQTWEAMRAKYSALEARAEAPEIPGDGLPAMLELVNRMVTRVRLGRSRRWRAQPRGSRFDLRHTLRASLHSGGDPVTLRFLGHPLRNPRFVVLIDGSRSMTAHGAHVLQFAYALVRRSRRASVFVFSTRLRDVTRALRTLPRTGGARLTDLGEAWGGGTRIGANLTAFVRSYGRLLSTDTVTIVASDGLDVGEIADLERAMREIDRRSSKVLWYNPSAARRGYLPTARGMAAALPYVAVLAANLNEVAAAAG